MRKIKDPATCCIWTWEANRAKSDTGFSPIRSSEPLEYLIDVSGCNMPSPTSIQPPPSGVSDSLSKGGNDHQEKSWLLLGARNFSVISPAKFGRLGLFYFCEVSTWLLKVRFWALSAAFSHFPSLSAL